MLTGYPRAYYSSSTVLEGEYVSEFGKDDDGHCSYAAYLGPYTSEEIDNKGQIILIAVLIMAYNH